MDNNLETKKYFYYTESSIKVKIKLYYLYEYRKQVVEEVNRVLGELLKK